MTGRQRNAGPLKGHAAFELVQRDVDTVVVESSERGFEAVGAHESSDVAELCAGRLQQAEIRTRRVLVDGLVENVQERASPYPQLLLDARSSGGRSELLPHEAVQPPRVAREITKLGGGPSRVHARMLPAEAADPAVYDRQALARKPEQGSWRSGEYVAEWIGDDVLAGLLTLPRAITIAIVVDAGIPVEHVLDLGSGSGPYLAALLRAFPNARGTWVDSSDPMEAIAQEPLREFGDRVSYVLGDVEQLDTLPLDRAEVVVTSRLIHNLPHAAQEEFYRSVNRLVTPGGFFFNLDHYAVPPGWEARYRRIREHFTGRRREPLAPHRDHPLTELRDHLGWLEASGFERPGVPWRTFHTALVAARKPA
jgi:ubiquinone/menaquinone biosynthesis C-methylase UbiE